MNNFILRTLSGILFVAVMVGCILGGSLSFLVLFLFVMAYMLWEFFHLLNVHNRASVYPLLSILSGIILFLAIFASASKTTEGMFSEERILRLFLLYGVSLLYLFISELYLKRPDPIANWGYTFLGQIYIALPVSLLSLLAYHGGQGYNYSLPLAVFVFLWLNDTGAYCFGSLLHKKIPYKLFERISPNKSWIGSIGGALVVAVAAWGFWKLGYNGSLFWWLGLGLTVTVFGTWGDLVESLLKRQLGIKDSGKFLPGHGGILDRFDSSLLAIPASVLYVYYTELALV